MQAVRPAVTAMATRAMVTVTSYREKELAGGVYSPYYGRWFHFEDAVGMLSILEGLCDELHIPQPSVQYRSLTGHEQAGRRMKAGCELADGKIENGKASFVVHVQFRQNATWQGTLQWLDKNKTMHFRSALEMLKMIDEALDENAETEREAEL
jgi:hypothetical protein